MCVQNNSFNRLGDLAETDIFKICHHLWINYIDIPAPDCE